ncbi:MAG: protein kinase, partial [Myxococcota bacterium]
GAPRVVGHDGDSQSDLRTVGRSTIELMSSLGHAKRLWGFALRISIVSHDPGRSLPTAVLAALPPRLRQVAEGMKAEPTVVAKEVLALTVAQIHKLLDQAEMALEHALRGVHSGIYVFVDKIDQALRGVSKEAWIAMQAGLMEAAWDLMNTNPHVKVFATIREEAFSAYESDIKTNLFGATTRIRYSRADLRHMLERLTTYYEGLPLRDFLTLDVVSAVGSGQTESAFDFLYRHTLGRPRDFVIVASEISRRRGELDERTFKNIVQDTCSAILIANVFDEMRVFLEVLGDRQARIRFLSLLPFPAMTREDLIEVWCRYHGVAREYFDNYARDSGDAFHPFRELHDCGLLGVINSDMGSGERSQSFKQPHHPLDAHRFDLPASEMYLLHPSLLALMQRQGLQDGFQILRDVVVGHSRPWSPLSAALTNIQRELVRAENGAGGPRGVSHSLRVILEDVARRVHAGEPMGRVLSETATSANYEALLQRLESIGWDELHLALLEVFSTETAVTREG